MKYFQIILAATGGVSLLGCGTDNQSMQGASRIIVSGEAKCLSEVTVALGQHNVGVARMPVWQKQRGEMEFGPIPDGRIQPIVVELEEFTCAKVEGERPSCRSNYSDLSNC